MEAHGFTITIIPVDSDGRISLSDVETTIQPDTIMISIIHANNEVGTIQPIADIAALAHRQGVLVHTDAAQSVG